MKRGLAVLVLLAGLIAAPLAYALLGEEPVFQTRKNERNPAADHDGTGGEVWAFSRSRSGYPNRYDAYVKEGANPLFRLNTAGQGWTGGIDYPLVAFQQVSSGQSNIRIYNLESDMYETPPDGVNTPAWEWHPTIYRDSPTSYWLLYGQDENSSPTQSVMLHHTSHEEHELATVTRASHYLQPDQVNGDWATYTRCAPVCNVWRYQISAGTRTRIAKPVTDRPRYQYAGAVTSTGAVYLVRSGPRCGEQVRIVRYDLTNPADPTYGTRIAALPSGFDIAFAFARENALDGSVDVFYDRVKCSTGRFDIYKVTDPAPGP